MVFPGGVGAAKNLSSWATEGTSCTVDDDVAAVIRSFHAANKAQGACCIAPVLFAKCIPGAKVTVGSSAGDDPMWPYAGTAGQISELGCVHEDADIRGVVVDQVNHLVTSPAYMYEGQPHEVFDSVGMMVSTLMAYTTNQGTARFSVGETVEAFTSNGWAKGQVVALNYREDEWPEGQVAPYQIMLESGALIFAPLDEDRVVRKAA